MKDKKNIFLNICYVLALCVVLFPLLLIAKYDYPSADDWSYGRESYKAIQAGAGVGTVLKISFQTVARHYQNWEGRFMNAFFASLQPGIWGEQYYAVVPWLMLGGLIFGEMVFFGTMLHGKESKNRWLWLPVVIPTLILQILYTPNAIESFYWYTGGMNYTFVYGVSMVLLALTVKLIRGSLKGWKFGVTAVAAGVLAVVACGDNFATSLSTFLTLAVLSVLLLLYDRKAFSRMWYITVLSGGSLLVCLLAPGNTQRLNGNFGGETTGNVVEAVVMSLVRSATNIYSWTNVKVVLMLLLILPFAWKAVQNVAYDFKYPVIFTLIAFGLYASQIAATMYVDGTTGGGRMAAILYYSYHVWMVGNFCYWVGWLNRVKSAGSPLLTRISAVAGRVAWRHLVLYCAGVGLILAGVIYKCDLKKISSYQAYRDWRQGWAQQYAAEWQERLEVLHDETIEEAYFKPLSVYPEMLVYTDLQDAEGYTWVNKACASYYGKQSVNIIKDDSEEYQGK
jgi:hypothetical protein